MEHVAKGRYMRVYEAADYIGLSVSTLNKMRVRGDGPIFRKVGKRAVVYAIEDLDAFLEKGRRRSTSDPGLRVA